MSIREKMNQRPGIALGVVAAVIVTAAIVIALQVLPSETQFEGRRSYYSDDDGKTFFEESSGRLSPFDHNGKQAYRVQLYTCDAGASAFVGYLERFNQESMNKIRSAQQSNPSMVASAFDEAYSQMEVKIPGETQWFSRLSSDGNAVTRPSCPGGKGELKMLN